MYPDLFERNVNGFTVSITNAAQGSPSSSAHFEFSTIRGPTRLAARRSEARVRCRFMAKPAARENYRPGVRQGSPTGDGALPAHSGRSRRMLQVLTKMVIILVPATAASVQGDGEFNPVTLLTYFCR